MGKRLLFLNPVQHAERIYRITKDRRRKYHVAAPLIRYYFRTGRVDKALLLFQETLLKVKAIRPISERDHILFFEMFFLAKRDLGLDSDARSILKELARRAFALKKGSRERSDAYDHVAWGYAILGEYRKAIAVAFQEAAEGTAFYFIIEELLEAKRDAQAMRLLEQIRKTQPPPVTREEKLLYKIFGSSSVKYQCMLHGMIETYAFLGKIREAESLIYRLTDTDKQLQMFVTIAHYERERGRKKRALFYLHNANKLREKRPSPLPSDITNVARHYYGGIDEQLSLAKEFALIGKKDSALAIASHFLVLAGIKAGKKDIGYQWLLEKLADIYELCGKRAIAARVIRAGDREEYQEKKLDRCYAERIKAGDFKGAYFLFKKMSHKWRKIHDLCFALTYCAEKQLIF